DVRRDGIGDQLTWGTTRFGSLRGHTDLLKILAFHARNASISPASWVIAKIAHSTSWSYGKVHMASTFALISRKPRTLHALRSWPDRCAVAFSRANPVCSFATATCKSA